MLLINVSFIVFLVLTALASSILESPLWSLSSWSFVSYTFGAICAAIAILVLIFNRGISDKLYRVESNRSSLKSRRFLAAFAAAVLVLWLFRARHDFWGERFAIATAVENGAVFRPGGPLATFLHWALYRFVNSTLIWNSTAASALMSIMAGLCYLVASVHAFRLLTGGKENSPMAVSITFLLSNGFVVLFFGSGGNTPVAVLLSSLFIISALSFAGGKTSLILPAVILLVSVLSHPSTVYLVPGFIYMAVLGFRSPDRRLNTSVAIGLLIVAWVALEFILAAATGGPGPTGFLLSLAANSLKTMHSSGLRALPGHLLAALNGFLVIGPASAAALILLVIGIFKGKSSGDYMGQGEILLVFFTVPAILMFLLAPGYIAGGLRWDIFAATGPAFAFYVLYILRRRLPDPRRFNRAIVLIAALGIFHTIPLLVLNSSPGAAEKRLLSLPLTPGRGEMILGSRAMNEENFDKAFEWFSLAVEKDSSDDRSYFELGELNMKKEEYVDAITSYSSALELKPENRAYRLKLAEAFIAKRWFEEAIDNLEELTSVCPDTVLYWRRLGYARNHSGLYEEAIEAYEKALALEPGSEENARNLTSAVLNRAAQLQGDQELEKARKLYFRAIQLYPLDWIAYNNLAVMEMDKGNTREAYNILRKAIDQNPFVSKLNLNMGIVLEKLGREDEALQYLHKSLELDPMHSGASIHIERIEKKMNKQGGE